MATEEQRRECTSDSLQTAKNWRDKGNVAWEERSLSSVVMNFLAIAVETCGDISEANKWFAKESEFSTVLSRYAGVLSELVDQVDAARVPPSIIDGNYPHLAFAHLAWALGDFSLGELLTRIASRPDVMELSTPFWQEYAMAVMTLVSDRPYTQGRISAQGQEEYWLPYLHLIGQAANNDDTCPAIAEIDDAFAGRNSDKAIRDDAHEIDGSGLHPVRWGFRRDGSLNYIRQGARRARSWGSGPQCLDSQGVD